MGKAAGSRRRQSLWVVVSALLVVHVVCWAGTRALRRPTALVSAGNEQSAKVEGWSGRLVRRRADGSGYETPAGGLSIANTSDPFADEPQVGSYISYWDLYDGIRTRGGKAGGFILLLLWLAFLFAFVGIVASDFFCPNLSTIASRLGLSESVAGVTFLGLGNGSPDVFSTFAAMRAGVGPLAIGELFGAAAFITSVVAGSMTLIRPFRVPRHSFLRDVGFFTLAVLCTMGILWDGKIQAWEAGGMVVLYAIYVAVVAVGTWWLARRRRRLETLHKVRSEYAVEGEEPQFQDDPDFPSQPSLSPSDSRPPLATRRSNNSATSTLLSSPHLVPIEFPSSPSGPAAELEVADEAALHDMSQTRTHRHRSSILPGGRVRQPSVHMARREVTPPPSSSGAQSSPSNQPPPSPLLNRSAVRTRRPTAAASSHGHASIRPSLLGAIEFRDVVNSLTSQAAATGSRPSTLLFERPTSSGMLRHGRSSSFSHLGSGSLGLSVGHDALTPRESSSQAPVEPRIEGAGDAERRAVSSGGWGRARGHRHVKSAIVPSSRPPWQWERSPSIDERGEPEWSTTEDEDGPGPHAPAHSRGFLEGPGPMVWDPPDEERDVDPWRGATPTRTSLKLQIPSPSANERSGNPSPAGEPAVPSIVLTGAAGHNTVISELASPAQRASANSGTNPLFAPSRPRKAWILFKTALCVLFPSLQSWSMKSWVGRTAALVSAPAILLLNLTLPVVDDDDCESSADEAEKDDEASIGGHEEEEIGGGTPESAKLRNERRDQHIAHRLHSPAEFPHHDHHGDHHRPQLTVDLLESPADMNGSADVPHFELPPPHHEVWSGPSDAQITRVLSAVQCFFAPTFCLLALFGDALHWWHFPIALGVGVVLSGMAYVFLSDVHKPARLGLCFIGFFVAMVWILTIVNEVVGVLQCIGRVLGLSDAILGLTIFAIGNSLGDLVANVTVARMGFPVMAMSACFGGPMLNVLLGIGISSSYMIASSGKPCHIVFSPTLIVSGIGLVLVLVATLIIVPLNGFLMSRKLGSFLILAYCCVLAVNVVVEVQTSKSKHH